NAAVYLVVLPPGLLLNGSFEYSSAGWILEGSVSASTKPIYGFTDGEQMVHFNAGQSPISGVLSQSFRTEPGAIYHVRFDLGAFSLLTQREQWVHVTVTGMTNLLSEFRSVNSPGNGTDYVPQIFSF